MLAISGRNRNQPKSLQTLRASGWGVVVDSKFTSSHSVLEASLASFRQAFARSASMRQLGLQWQDFAFLLLLVSFCFYGAVTKDGSFERFAACLTIWNGCMSSIDIDISRSDQGRWLDNKSKHGEFDSTEQIPASCPFRAGRWPNRCQRVPPLPTAFALPTLL